MCIARTVHGHSGLGWSTPLDIGARVFGDKSFTFDADDAENACARLADRRVCAVKHDFRPTWIGVKKR